ncbi:hypothetical protein QD47_08305 [Paenibacillus terrae]|uniref:Phage tail tape measure protein domain-containing protein n=2 Tax=Paenibacillus terrae TaxID=159743 RepID=A0A0D7X3H6_9BACL|nr:hypothetical protein QD47_08305 [Paenibacillus terrae]
MLQIQASTGQTEAQMKGMKDIAKNLYNAKLGEDWNDLALVVGKAKNVLKQTGPELEKSARGAIVLRDTFENLDVDESIKTVDTMMKNFGVTSEQAYNLLAQGAQKGLDKSGELLDSANEYSAYFAKLGFSAEGMFDIFAAGLDAGAFNLDKVGIKPLPTINRGIKRGGCNANPNRRLFKGQSGATHRSWNNRPKRPRHSYGRVKRYADLLGKETGRTVG